MSEYGWVNDVSRKVYQEIIAEGLVTKLQALAGEMLVDSKPLTANEIGKKMGVAQRTTYAPRIKELEDMGVIRKADKRPCTVTGRTGYTFELTGKRPVRPAPKPRGAPCLFCRGTGIA